MPDDVKSKKSTDNAKKTKDEEADGDDNGEEDDVEDEEEEAEEEEEDEEAEEEEEAEEKPAKPKKVVKEKPKAEPKASAKNGEKKSAPSTTGKPLGAIALIDANIVKTKMDALQALHMIVYEKEGKAPHMKKMLKKFDGFSFELDSEDYKQRLEAVEKIDEKKLAQTAEVLVLETTGTKEELAERILKFLLKPDGEEELPQEEGEDEEAAEEEEEDVSEEETKKPSKRAAPTSGRGREASKSSGGRPKRSTAGRGYQGTCFWANVVRFSLVSTGFLFLSLSH